MLFPGKYYGKTCLAIVPIRLGRPLLNQFSERPVPVAILFFYALFACSALISIHPLCLANNVWSPAVPPQFVSISDTWGIRQKTSQNQNSAPLLLSLWMDQRLCYLKAHQPDVHWWNVSRTETLDPWRQLFAILGFSGRFRLSFCGGSRFLLLFLGLCRLLLGLVRLSLGSTWRWRHLLWEILCLVKRTNRINRLESKENVWQCRTFLLFRRS